MGNGTIRRWAGAVALGLVLLVAACGQRGARAPVPPPQAPPIIARADLFGEPVRQGAQLSPRGDRVAFLAPRDGVTNLWVLTVGAADQPTPVTDEQQRGIVTFAWAQGGQTLLYLQDTDGDENWRLYAVSAAGGEPRALTPAGARAQILGLSGTDPSGVVVTLNDRDAAWPDVYRYDITSGQRTRLQRNAASASVRGFASYVLDRQNRVRLGIKTLPDGGQEVFARAPDGTWSSLFRIPFEDVMSSRVLGFEADGRTFLMLDSTDKERAYLVRVDATTGVKTAPLGESARADVVDVWLDPVTNAPEAYASEYLRRDWRALAPDAQADLDFLDAQLTGEFSVVSRAADDSRWIVLEEGPTTPPRSYIYDRAGAADRRLTLLFRHRPALEQAPLQAMTPVEIEARDGLTLVSYLTLPIGSDTNGDGRPERPVPLVIVPHGGPWARDSYGFNPLHQWLANRGYAVLSVNFRGSAGFGKAFLNAGNGEWGGRMQEDLLDAVQWAVEGGIAQPDRVSIIGAGYGGYAALAGLSLTPDQYRCGASFAGNASLSGMLETMPAWRRPWREDMYLRIGDPRTAEGQQRLRDRSPLSRIAQIRRPLLLVQGGHDPRVPRSDADAVAGNLRARRVPLTYLFYPDEGHGLSRPQNRLAFFAIAEQFLGDCLGGRIEPVGAAFGGANLQALDGAASVPGLSAFAPRRPAATATTTTEEAPPATTTGPAGGPEETSAVPQESAPPLPASTLQPTP